MNTDACPLYEWKNYLNLFTWIWGTSHDRMQWYWQFPSGLKMSTPLQSVPSVTKVHSVTVNNFATEGTYRNGGDTSPYILVFIRKGNITNCFSSATMNERTTWTCSREFEALHTIECSDIGNFLQAWRCPLHYKVSPPLRKSTPLQHENLLYLSFPFTYNDYFTESNLVDTPICNKAKSICFYEHA